MTPFELDLAAALGACSIRPGTSMKRFCRDLAHAAKNDPGRELTLRQRHYMEILAWRFRRQLAPHLVPARKPLDLPSARKDAKPRKNAKVLPPAHPDLFA